MVQLDEMKEDFDPEESQALYCVPARIWEDEKPMLTVLLLELVHRGEATYRRFGVANSRRQVEMEVLLRTSDEAADFPALEYRDGRHVIRLV